MASQKFFFVVVVFYSAPDEIDPNETQEACLNENGLREQLQTLSHSQANPETQENEDKKNLAPAGDYHRCLMNNSKKN